MSTSHSLHNLREPFSSLADRADVRFVDQLPLDAAPQTILVHVDRGLLAYRQLARQRLALHADAGDPEGIRRLVVQVDATEVDRQAVLEAPHDRLEDAAQG